MYEMLGGGGGDDFQSMVSTNPSDDEDFSRDEPELKYFPPVKIEQDFSGAEDAGEDPAFNLEFEDASSIINPPSPPEEAPEPSSERSYLRQRRKKLPKIDSDYDDDDDYTWTSSAKRKKSKSTRSRGRGRPKKSDREKPKMERKKKSPSSERPQRAPRKPRKKVSEMTPEELEENRKKWKEEAEVRRQRQREDGTGGSGRKAVSDMTPEELETNRRKKAQARRERQKSEGNVRSRRKKVADMTPEELEENRKKWRKESEARRQRQRAEHGKLVRTRRKKVSEMTPEELEENRKKWREEARRRRQLRFGIIKTENAGDSSIDGERPNSTSRRNITAMTPEQLEEYRAKMREERRQWRANLAPEQREEYKRRERERTREKRAKMTPEQKQELKQRATMNKLERQAAMTEDEKKFQETCQYMKRVVSRQRALEWSRAKRAKMTEEDLEKRRERIRAYRRNMTPEQRENFLSRLRESARRRLERIKGDPAMRAEARKKWKERHARRRDAGLVKSKKQIAMKKSEETEEEYQERLARIERQRKEGAKRWGMKRKMKIQSMLSSGMSMDEVALKLETPEQRERRLVRHRINRAKRIARQQLSSVGAPPEQIEQKLKEVEATFQVTTNFRPFRPHSKTLASIDTSQQNASTDDVVNVDECSDVDIKVSPVSSYTTTASTSPIRRRGRPKKSVTKATKSSSIVPSTSSSSQQQQVHPPPPTFFTLLEQPAQAHQQFHQATPPATTSSHQQHQFVSAPPVHSYPPQPTFNLQTILDTVSYQDHPVASTSQNFAHHHQYYHQQQDYASSSYNGSSVDDNYDNYYSSPPSPPSPPSPAPKEEEIHDPQESYMSIREERKPPPPLHPKPKPSTTAANSSSPFIVPPRPVAKAKPGKWLAQRGVPRGAYKFNSDDPDVIPCEICGNGYKKSYMREHTQQMHNPHFQNSTCLLCGLTFRQSRKFIIHYRNVHLNLSFATTGQKRPNFGNQGATPVGTKDDFNPNVHVVCDECGNSYRKSYIRQHKLTLHHPNFKDSKCTLCDQPFTGGREFFNHFQKCHPQVKEWQLDPERSHMCEECGACFKMAYYLKKHTYYTHGPGLNKEDYHQCPMCPGKYKEKGTFLEHMRKKHPEYKTHPCGRCSRGFNRSAALKEHYVSDHNGEFYSCQFCKTICHTQEGILFHYVRCPRRDRKLAPKIRDEFDQSIVRIEQVRVACEFCERKLIIGSMTRHYDEIHKVAEDEFLCDQPNCDQKFKRRLFWVVHLIDFHGLTMTAELKEKVGKLNVREKGEIYNVSGEFGGPGGREKGRKLSKRNAREEGEEPKLLNFQTSCEFCRVKITLAGLYQHYKTAHGVKEDKWWECATCEKKIKSRQVFTNHLIRIHGQEWNEQMEELVKPASVENRDAMTVKNPNGHAEMAKKRGKKRKLADTTSEDTEECQVKRKKPRKSETKKKTANDRRKTVTRKEKQEEIPEDDESEEEWKSSDDEEEESETEEKKERIPTGKYGTRAAARYSMKKSEEPEAQQEKTKKNREDTPKKIPESLKQPEETVPVIKQEVEEVQQIDEDSM